MRQLFERVVNVRMNEGRAYRASARFYDRAAALGYLLLRYRDMGRSEVRDRVYGLLRILQDVPATQSDFQILADYASTSLASLPGRA